MKTSDQDWSRLVKAARLAGEPQPAMPYGFETRAIAGWRAERRGEDLLRLKPLLVRALFCSGLAMALSLAANIGALRGEHADELSIAASALRLSLAP